MTAALALTALIADAHARPADVAHLARFGFTCDGPECPAATRQYRRAQALAETLQGLGQHAYWYGREHLRDQALAEANWRKDVWYAAWWASDCRYQNQAAYHMTRLKNLIGPAYYRLGVMPAPVAGERGRGE